MRRAPLALLAFGAIAPAVAVPRAQEAAVPAGPAQESIRWETNLASARAAAARDASPLWIVFR